MKNETNMKIEKTKIIAGQTVKITLQGETIMHPIFPGKTIKVWTASNDTGEPKQTVKPFSSAAEALRNEVKELESILS